MFAAATDFTCAEATVASEALRTRAAKTGLFIVVLTFPYEFSSDWAGAFSFGAGERVAPLVINY